MFIGLGINLHTGRASGGTPTPTPATFIMSQLPYANRIYPRQTTIGGTNGYGYGTIDDCTLNVTGAGTIWARLLLESDGTTVVQGPWLAVANASVGNGIVPIPNVDVREERVLLSLSPDGVTGWQNGTTPFRMAFLIAVWGQSITGTLFKRRSTNTIASVGVSIPPNGYMLVSIDEADSHVPSAWALPSDATALNGAGAPELMDYVRRTYGITPGIVGKSIGQTTVEQWQAGTTRGDALAATLDLGGGRYEDVVGIIGHSNAAANTTFGAFQTGLGGVHDNVIAPNNSFPSPTIILSSISNMRNTLGLGTAITQEIIRWAADDFCNQRGYISLLTNDLSMNTDGTHPIAPGSKRLAHHIARAMRPSLGLSHSDKGATLGTPTHAPGSLDIVIPFTLAAGSTALSITGSLANAASKWKVYKSSDRATLLTFDATTPIAIDNTADTITLKLASDPGQVPLEIVPYGYQELVDDGSAAGIFDDLNDGDGISVGRQIWPGVRPLRVSANMNLTLASATFAASANGQAMTGGTGTAPANAIPGLVTGVSIQFDSAQTGTTGSNEVFCGQNGSGLWIGRNGTNLVVAGSVTYTFTGVLPADGVYRQVLVTIQPNSGAVNVYINTVPQTSPGSTSYAQGTTSAFAIRKFGNSGTPQALTTARIDEVALFEGIRTPSLTPLTGAEPGLKYWWRLDGDGVQAV